MKIKVAEGHLPRDDNTMTEEFTKQTHIKDLASEAHSTHSFYSSTQTEDQALEVHNS